MLLMRDPKVFVAGFDRPNLFLEVLNVTGDADKRDACLTLAAEGSGLIYCSTRKAAEGLHQSLEKKGVEAVLYHAGMDDEARRQAQDRFMSSPRAVAVATNAFGMGIDKADIRFVAHAGIPRAVEAYYQEIGRAGRDGKPAHAVLLFNHADVFTQERLIQGTHPPQTLIADVWNVLSQTRAFDKGVAALATALGANEFEVGAAVKILERLGKLSRAGARRGPVELHADRGSELDAAQERRCPRDARGAQEARARGPTGGGPARRARPRAGCLKRRPDTRCRCSRRRSSSR